MTSVDTHTGVVVALAFGGQGIIRHEGLVVFVPFTAIGDRIAFKIVSSKKNYAQGCLVSIIEPSPDRTAPPCPYFGRCGGCQLQHLQYPAQLSAKRKWVEEALQRFGGWNDVVVPPVVAALSMWHYRRRIALHLKVDGKGFALGYISTDNVTTLVVDQCPIFVESTDTILSDVRRLVQSLDNRHVEEGRVNILKVDEGKYILDFHFTTMPRNAEEVFGRREGVSTSIVGIVVSAPHKTLKYGVREASLIVEGLEFTYSSRTFMQNHPDQSLEIYREVVGQVDAAGEGVVLDLYCGIGISSLLLARQGRRVVGVESNVDAIHLAQQSAKDNLIDSVKFVCADVAGVLDKLLAKEKARTVIVNPPREGLADKVREALVANPPERLIYISCMPSTLARDLKLLKAVYDPVGVKAYDMFPQTTHVETVLTLQKR